MPECFILCAVYNTASMPICHQCRSVVPDQARFCPFCGVPQHRQEEEPPFVDDKGDVEARLVTLFFDSLRREVTASFPALDMQALTERLYASGFRDMLHRRMSQLAEQIKAKNEAWTRSPATQKKHLLWLFDELIDYFLIRHAADMVSCILPEAILKYQQHTLASIDPYAMVMDYMGWSQETESVYTDFLAMPVDHLRNASKYFLFPEKSERIFFICDQSIFGGCTEGFAITERGLYWKAPLAKAKRYLFLDEANLELSKEWLTINDSFFNAGTTLNYKIFKLLKKMHQLLHL